jgi:ABC-type nitrate/sulfonate/bicarbonate transport system substrate-binding protein
MEKIRIALANRGAGTAPVFATVEGGYFREQGLDPELIPFQGHSRSLQALIAGDADFTNAVGAEAIMANRRHKGDAVIVASAVGRSAQQVSARPGLATRESLRGKRWGILARKDADECAIAVAFERWGWDMARDAEIVVVGNEGPRLDLLLDAARVDVAITHAPEPFQAARRGWNAVEDLARLDVAFQNSCAATTRRLVQSRPALALAYVRAYCRGVHRFRTDAAFGIEVLRKYTGESDRQILEPTWIYFSRLMGGTMFPSVEGMRGVSDALVKIGAIAEPVPPEETVDLSLVARLERENYFATVLGVPGRAVGGMT